VPHIDAVSAPGTTHTIHAGQVAIEEGSRTNGGCASGTCWRRQEPPKSFATFKREKKSGNSQQTLGISFFLAIIFPIFPHINYLSLLPWGIRSSQKTIHEIIKNNSIMVG
jgi:hypothetical protein